ncbi:MAG: hypothetical protein ACSHX0_01600 [Akkermansiaceae bacterium]
MAWFKGTQVKVFFHWMTELPRWKKCFYPLVSLFLIVLLSYGVSNIVLSSPWAKGKVEHQIKKRTGLDSKLGSLSWSPWSGLTLRQLKILQIRELRDQITEPLASIKEVKVVPYWKPLLKRKLELKDVRVDSPSFVVSVEMLAALASSLPPVKEKKPLVAQKAPPAKKATKPQMANKKPALASNAKPKAVAAKKPQTKKPQLKKISQAPAGKPIWLHVDHAAFKLISFTKKVDLLAISGVSLHTPVFGEDAEGRLKIGLVQAPGLSNVMNLEEKIQWRRPFLQIKDENLNLAGLSLAIEAKLALDRKRLMTSAYQIKAVLKPQSLGELHDFEWLGIVPDADQVRGEIGAAGYFFNPVSWRGAMLATATNLHIKEKHGNQQIQFDEVSIPLFFSQCQFHWSDVRLVGDDISILGNGGLSVHNVLAVTRFVVSPEFAAGADSFLLGSMIKRRHGSWWSNLETPDRKVRDLVISGNLKDPLVDAGDKKEQMPLSRVIELAMTFIRNEMKEEGKVLQPISNQEMLHP